MKSIQTELLHVLLADDDAEDRNLFSAILKRTNIPAGLTEFKNAMDLLKYLENPENTIPDFIFLDINMPVMNGKECLREIRKKPLHRYVPVIICSTTNYKQDIDETFADGANLFVPKNTLSGDIFEKIFSFIWQQNIFNRDPSNFVLSEHKATERIRLMEKH